MALARTSDARDSETIVSFDDKTLTIQYPHKSTPINKVQVYYDKMSAEALANFPKELNQSYDYFRKNSKDPKQFFRKESELVEGVTVLSCDAGYEVTTGAHGDNIISSARCLINRKGNKEQVKICGSSMTQDAPPEPLDTNAPLKETLLKHSCSCMGG